MHHSKKFTLLGVDIGTNNLTVNQFNKELKKSQTKMRRRKPPTKTKKTKEEKGGRTMAILPPSRVTSLPLS
jgi:hypothetical protein